MPDEAFEAVHEAVVKTRPAPEFKRVVMSLQDVLGGDFFTEYIKKGRSNIVGISALVKSNIVTGNIMMLSEGRIGIDNVYSLKDGMHTKIMFTQAIADIHLRNSDNVS